MKKGKEIKLDLFENYNIVYGTVDNKNPKSIYIELSAWGEPLNDSELINYKRVLGNFNKKIKQTLFDFSDPKVLIRDMNIVDLDMRESGISYNKKSFMNCEITLFQVEPKPVNTDEVGVLVESIISELITKAFDGNEYFKFYRGKNIEDIAQVE